MANSPSPKSSIVTNVNLQTFFLDSLVELNRKSLMPVPIEAIVYSSQILNIYMDPMKYFEVSDEGKVRQKILGMKLLEAYQVGREEQKRVYKDVGDSALILCGMFNESINRKILDISYYHSVGKRAYNSLNQLEKRAENPELYEIIAESFLTLTTLISKVSIISKNNQQDFLKQITEQQLTNEELLALGVIPNPKGREN